MSNGTKKLLNRLERKIGIRFKSHKLPIAALTHPSYPTHPAGEAASHAKTFQRLEFLGDAVLNFFTARRLYQFFPEADEGMMSKLRSTLVSRKLLARVARRMRLESFLRTGKTNDRLFSISREKILADSLEALIAAIYLDRGLKTVEQFLTAYFESHLDPKKLFQLDPNPKSTLQEHVQKKWHILPAYQTGPRRKDRFSAWISIQGKNKTRGEGRTLREAEADAAARLLRKLKIKKKRCPAEFFVRKEVAPKD